MKPIFKVVLVVIAALVVGAGWEFLSIKSRASELVVGNIKNDSYADTVSFTVANTSSNNGDVVMGVQQGDNAEECIFITHIEAKSRQNITIPCKLNPAEPKFQIFTGWAEYFSREAAIADRLH